MRICPECNKEVPDHDWYCPYCHKKLPSLNRSITGHASFGNLEEYNAKVIISYEDKNMIRDKNHQSSSSQDDRDMDCEQPYSYVTRENGDRN